MTAFCDSFGIPAPNESTGKPNMKQAPEKVSVSFFPKFVISFYIEIDRLEGTR